MPRAELALVSCFAVTILKPGDGAAVVKGATVTVHATGVVQETGKKFWSTKDPDQQPFTYTAGAAVTMPA